MSARGPVLCSLVLGAGSLTLGLWVWNARRSAPERWPPPPRVSVPVQDFEPLRPEVLPDPPTPDRERLLADARSHSSAIRVEAGAHLGRALDRTNDPELLNSLHALALRDPSVEVRRAALGELVFRNDRSSFDILLETATSASAPPAVRLRAIELLERPGRKDYGLFLRNHGCPEREADQIASRRRDRARTALLAVNAQTPDPELRDAIRKVLAKLK